MGRQKKGSRKGQKPATVERKYHKMQCDGVNLFLKVRYSEKATKDWQIFHSFFSYLVAYRVDVLCRQQIKLFHVVSTSEFHEYQWNNVVFIFFLSPRVSGGPQKLQTLTASKTKYEKFGPKI